MSDDPVLELLAPCRDLLAQEDTFFTQMDSTVGWVIIAFLLGMLVVKAYEQIKGD